MPRLKNRCPFTLHIFYMVVVSFLQVWVCVCAFGFNVVFNNFSVISRRCLVATWSSILTFRVLPHWSISCPRQLTWYHTQSHYPDTGSHIILTPGRPVPALPSKSESNYIVPFLTTLICPVPRSGNSTDWAIGAGCKFEASVFIVMVKFFLCISFNLQKGRKKKERKKKCSSVIGSNFLREYTERQRGLSLRL